ncbi:MAG: serine/threonine protein kinase, partial [Planctomycetaceae bacterium]|nr:serine/threonine protein kinase [Planctomycetaceae bacterium]
MTGHSDNSNAFLLADGSEELSPTVMWTPPDAIHYVSATPVLTSSRYKLGELICYGGMGVVYAARDLHLDRDVAVKVLRLQPDRHPDAVRLYTREAKIISRLSHPGIVPIYDFGLCTDGRPYHVMKLVQGGTLSELISSADGNVSHLLTVFADVCQTMAFVHTQGIIHMDLKPSNVMVGAFGEVYVMDWGLARFQKSVGQDRPGLTIRLSSDLADFIPDDGYASHVGVCGTPGYMSPEQARGDAVDARADVFGLGAILCEILVGHAPYVGHDARQVYLNARRGSIDATMLGLEECDSDRALVRLARRCLTTDRNDRPASAVEVSAAVSTYQETALQRVESDMNRFFELSLDLFC